MVSSQLTQTWKSAVNKHVNNPHTCIHISQTQRLYSIRSNNTIRWHWPSKRHTLVHEPFVNQLEQRTHLTTHKLQDHVALPQVALIGKSKQAGYCMTQALLPSRCILSPPGFSSFTRPLAGALPLPAAFGVFSAAGALMSLLEPLCMASSWKKNVIELYEGVYINNHNI